MSSVDTLQWSEIAKINQRLFALEENVNYLLKASKLGFEQTKEIQSYLNTVGKSLTVLSQDNVLRFDEISLLKKQMVKAGQDLTYFGQKVGELDATDTALWAAHTEQGKWVDGINSRLSAQVVELGGKVGGGGIDTGGLLGGLGIGSLVALGAVAFILMKK